MSHDVTLLQPTDRRLVGGTSYGPGMDFEAPDELLGRLRLGREEYCQRLLTCLILDASYPRWNSRSRVSPNGRRFLKALDELCFGSADIEEPLVFVDEFELPPRHDDEKGGAPDYAVLTGNRIWLIELKTERGSHRKGQLAGYDELTRHHHPGVRVDMTYLTGGFQVAPPRLDPDTRYAHLTWDKVLPLVRSVWGADTDAHRVVVDTLESVVGGLTSPWSAWRDERLTAVVAPQPPEQQNPGDEISRAAQATATDGEQRAVEAGATTLEELQQLRLDALRQLDAHPDPQVRYVRPWLWRAATSGGRPLTESGAETGYELRLSRYKSARV